MTAHTVRRGGVVLVLAITVTSLLLFAVGAGTARATAKAAVVYFDGSPGFGAPPPTLGGYPMTPFPDNGPCTGATVIRALGPNGSVVSFSPSVQKFDADCLGGFGQGGGNNYPLSGDVWANEFPLGQTSLTIYPSVNTRALYFYGYSFSCLGAQPVWASSGGTTSPVFFPQTNCGGTSLPQYFGFYVTSGQLPPITIYSPTSCCGVGIGEFANNYAKIRKV